MNSTDLVALRADYQAKIDAIDLLLGDAPKKKDGRGRPKGSANKVSAGKPKRKMSAAHRKALKEAQKKRWARVKAAEKQP